ncbi:MAG TPA: hypothetical protein VJU14_14305 [Solirubrobacterales bacterium]|nr:hypothetical protein [Solirubrobacterales bacterium]
MAAVVAAILAAFLAGAIALFRERRLEARRLRIAARVVKATVEDALVVSVLVSEGKFSWEKMCAVLSKEELSQLWDAHRDVLAGHLSREEWISTQGAISRWMRIFLAEPSTPDSPGWDKFWTRMKTDLRDAQQTLDSYCD